MVKIESRERTARSPEKLRPRRLRLRHKQFLLLANFAHDDFFELLSYAETGRVNCDRFCYFADPVWPPIDSEQDAQLAGRVVLLE